MKSYHQFLEELGAAPKPGSAQFAKQKSQLSKQKNKAKREQNQNRLKTATDSKHDNVNRGRTAFHIDNIG